MANGTTEGGLENYLGESDVTNSTFAMNEAYEGGAIFNGNANLSIVNSTFFANTATTEGKGAVLYAGGLSGSISISNSILAASTGSNCVSYIAITASGNISDDNSCGFGNPVAANGQTIGDKVNPQLDPNGLSDNGGPTQTIALQSTSPAVDALPLANCPATDQRGYARPDPDGASACDIGAYEFGAVAPSPTPTQTATPTPTATSTLTQTPTPTATLTPVSAKLTASPKRLSFKKEAVGSSEFRTLVLKNETRGKKAASVQLESIAVTDGVQEFAISSPCDTGELITRGMCAIQVAYTASATGKQSGTLTIRSMPRTIH